MRKERIVNNRVIGKKFVLFFTMSMTLCHYSILHAQSAEVLVWLKSGADALKAEDYIQAQKWYQKAADKGDVQGEYALASFYNDKPGPKDFHKAMDWFRKAWDKGNVAAGTKIGIYYDRGQGVSQDFKEALKWWKKAADKGDSEAEKEIGMLYDNGQGVPRDYQEALKWYQKAVAQGFAPAQKSIDDLKKRMAR
jgi:TPR repeat protein